MTRADVTRTNGDVKRFPDVALALERLRDPFEQLLGAPITMEATAPRVVSAEQVGDAIFDPGVAIAIDGPDGLRAVVTLDARIAAVLVDRALGGEGGPTIGGPAPLSSTEAGVVAFLCAYALRQLALSWVVARVEVQEPAALLPEETALRSDISLYIAGDRGLARFVMGRSSLPQAQAREPGQRSLPVTLVARRGRASLTRRDLRSLEHGDVVVLADAYDHVRVQPRGDSSTTWECTEEEGALRIARCIERPKTEVGQGAKQVTETPTGDSPTEVQRATLGDVPIEVSVELARFTLPLAELSSLRPGEILTSGVALTDRVALRAGDKVIAMGELIEVDGEVGVRINTLAP